jgi:Ser-tRNA(Ala) deacylase AlaX
MRKVFWDAPYQQALKTKVAKVEGNRVLLEETIAFSFSGGQESDKATVNGLPILDSTIENLQIYYSLPDGHNLVQGQDVAMQIDWSRRYKLMRLHFAAELILELVTRKYNLENIGAHIAEDKARIDFVCSQNISTFFEEILDEYRDIIHKDLPIHTGFLDISSQRRYWKIDGFAEVPCGGTHVKSTCEVGLVTLKRCNIGSSKERIEIRLVDTPL